MMLSAVELRGDLVTVNRIAREAGIALAKQARKARRRQRRSDWFKEYFVVWKKRVRNPRDWV